MWELIVADDQVRARILSAADVAVEAKKLLRKGTPRLAVAFWGSGAAKRLGLTSSRKGRIVCNLGMGGTNPDEIQLLLDKGFSVRQCDVLHSKLYLSDGGAILGSSNASANGLSYQGTECRGWLELNILIEPSIVHRQTVEWFEKLWSSRKVRKISKKDLEVAREIWSRRRRTTFSKNNLSSDETLLNQLRRNPSKFSDRRVFLTLYSEPLSDDGQTLIEQEKTKVKNAGGDAKNLDCFEDWDDLPNDADHICFYVGSRGGIKYEGVWNIPPNRKLVPLKKNKTNLTLCWRSDFRLMKNEIDEWKTIVQLIKKEYPSRDGLYFDLKEVYENFLIK